MTRLTDGNMTAEITMRTWECGNGYSPDWSADFFDVGLLPYDEETEAYKVKSVDYCAEQARDWEEGVGEYNDNPTNEDREVIIDYIDVNDI